MATYKVLQDIEAEDKFLGPLTLKQFILACITLVSGYLAGVATFKYHAWPLDIVLVPIMLFSGFLAFPWGRDQPTETWLLAKLRFMLVPRRRIWDQTGMRELVTITAPKNVEEQFTGNNLSQTEVKSRLKALANTIDSRGWAIKNVNVNLYAEPNYGATVINQTDRLVDASTLAHDVPSTDIQAADDILDERNNPTAQHLDQMITTATQNYRQETLQQMQDIRDHKRPKRAHAAKKADANEPPADYWFMNQPQPAPGRKHQVTFGTSTVQPGSQSQATGDDPLTADEQKLLDERHKASKANTKDGHPTIKRDHPKSHSASKTKAKNKPKTPKPPVTPAPDPAIISLANDNDKSVATLAREASKQHEPDLPDGEVVISLH